MPNNKKSKQKKKSSGSDDSAGPNLNAEVLESLTRLADKLAQLDEACFHVDTSNDGAAEDLAKITADMSLNDGGGGGCTTGAAQSSTLTPPALPISHWRTLPLQVTSAYKILHDGAEYIHATSTKYTLVGKVDSKEGGNLAVELRKGAELIGTATLLLHSQSCGSSRSLRHYVKQYSRAVIASVISLVTSFEDGTARGKANDRNNIGAQKTGAVWSACDNLTKSLPKGNRAAMRRELMVWVRDCNESIEEFEEVLALGPRDGAEDDGEEEDMMDEEQYTESEMKVAKASVNVMKCSKNLLGLTLKACECVGDYADKLSQQCDQKEDDGAQQNSQKQKDMLQWISNLHEMARTVGEGVTNFGILLYPPLDVTSSQEDLQKWQAKKSKTTVTSDEQSIPSLGSTILGLQLEHQLHALSECVMAVHEPSLPASGESIQSCMSEEVVGAAERLNKAVRVRCKEVEEATYPR